MISDTSIGVKTEIFWEEIVHQIQIFSPQPEFIYKSRNLSLEIESKLNQNILWISFYLCQPVFNLIVRSGTFTSFDSLLTQATLIMMFFLQHAR